MDKVAKYHGAPAARSQPADRLPKSRSAKPSATGPAAGRAPRMPAFSLYWTPS